MEVAGSLSKSGLGHSILGKDTAVRDEKKEAASRDNAFKKFGYGREKREQSRQRGSQEEFGVRWCFLFYL